jgi:hypothetical protein
LADYENSLFEVGSFDDERRMFHVLDDVTFSLLLTELDTVSDLIQYFRAKEHFFKTGNVFSVDGEENLLAAYLEDVDSNGKHYFTLLCAAREPSVLIAPY